MICISCGENFERSAQRGRPHLMCPVCRNNPDTHQMVAIPTFEKLDKVKVGDIVYHLPNMLNNEFSRRKFALEYRVVSVSGTTLEIIKNEKAEHKHYPIRVDASRLYRNVGVEYVEGS